MEKHLVYVAVAYLIGEAADVNIAYVVVKDAVIHSRRYLVVGAEVAALERVGVVGGMVFLP